MSGQPATHEPPNSDSDWTSVGRVLDTVGAYDTIPARTSGLRREPQLRAMSALGLRSRNASPKPALPATGLGASP